MGEGSCTNSTVRLRITRTAFEERVYKLTKKIPLGKVSTYADIATAMGDRRLARAVGNALGKNPYKDVPCYRVVRSDGAIGGYSAPGGSRTKARKLKADGLEVQGLQIIGLERYLVSPSSLGIETRKSPSNRGGPRKGRVKN